MTSFRHSDIAFSTGLSKQGQLCIFLWNNLLFFITYWRNNFIGTLSLLKLVNLRVLLSLASRINWNVWGEKRSKFVFKDTDIWNLVHKTTDTRLQNHPINHLRNQLRLYPPCDLLAINSWCDQISRKFTLFLWNHSRYSVSIFGVQYWRILRRYCTCILFSLWTVLSAVCDFVSSPYDAGLTHHEALPINTQNFWRATPWYQRRCSAPRFGYKYTCIYIYRQRGNEEKQHTRFFKFAWWKKGGTSF